MMPAGHLSMGFVDAHRHTAVRELLARVHIDPSDPSTTSLATGPRRL
jgi:hypothetical protein